MEHRDTRRLADAGEQAAAVIGDDAAGEERPDQLPRARTRHTGHGLVAATVGRLRWGASFAGEGDCQEEAHA